MKRILSCLLLLIWSGACVCGAVPKKTRNSALKSKDVAGKAVEGNVSDEWKLIWSDEFDRSGGVDLRKWTYEENLVRNETAKQLYTKDKKNVRQESGNLVFEARYEKAKNKNYDPQSPSWLKNREYMDYTSGSVNSRGKFTFKYGKVEIRAKFQYGKGVWPALWLIGTNGKTWPGCGEIDILEYISQDKDRVHGTLHWEKGSNFGGGHTNSIVVPNLVNVYHTYGMEWSKDEIVLFFDHKPFHRLDLNKTVSEEGVSPFREPFFFILNLAVGGWSENPEAKDYPRKFAIDYIRVYQRKDDKDALYFINDKERRP